MKTYFVFALHSELSCLECNLSCVAWNYALGETKPVPSSKCDMFGSRGEHKDPFAQMNRTRGRHLDTDRRMTSLNRKLDKDSDSL
jgi:hypothetical protein